MASEDLDKEIAMLVGRLDPPRGGRKDDAWIDMALEAVLFRLGELSGTAVWSLCRHAGIDRADADRRIVLRSDFRAAAEGRVRVMVCEGSSCFQKRSGRILNRVERVLGLKIGQTSADGKVCLVRALCLNHCEKGPNIQIGRKVHNDLTPDAVENLLQKL